MNLFCHQTLPKLSRQQPITDKVNDQFQKLSVETPSIRRRERRPISNVASMR